MFLAVHDQAPTDPTTATDRRVEGGSQWLFFAEKPGKIIRQASQEIMRGFDALVSPMDELIRTKSEEMKTLVGTRDLLLPKLMSGEILLGDAEKSIEVEE